MQNIFEEKFTIDAVLIEVGNLQVILSETGNNDFTFETLITNSKELLLEKWHKVALSGAIWSRFEAFLRNFIDNDYHRLPKDEKVVISTLMTTRNIFSLIPTFSTEVSTFVEEGFWESLFANATREFFNEKSSFYGCYKYCEVIHGVYSYFYHGCLNDRIFHNPISFLDKERDFIESYFFAEAFFYQFEVLFQKSNDYWKQSFLSQEIKEKYLDGLKSFFEKRKDFFEKVRKTMKEAEYFAKFRRISRVLNMEDDDSPEGFQIKKDESDELMKGKSIFQALSFCITGHEYFKDIFRLLCFVEVIRDSNSFKSISNFNRLQLNLILDEKCKIYLTKEELLEQESYDFSKIILKLMAKLIGKNIVLFNVRGGDAEARILPLCPGGYLYNQKFRNHIAEILNNSCFRENENENHLKFFPCRKFQDRYCQCECHYKAEVQHNFLTILYENTWLTPSPKWQQSCGECGVRMEFQASLFGEQMFTFFEKSLYM